VLDQMMRDMPQSITYYIADGVEYGIYQELGTHNEDGSRRMEARPHVMPVIEHHKAAHTDADVVRAYGINHIDRAWRSLAFTILADIKNMAPYRYGNLRNSYHVTKERPK